MKIVFMGTPEFAVPCLNKLIDAGKNVVAVVTTPDKKSGRGMKLRSSAVKQAADEHNIPVIAPLSTKDPQFEADLKAVEADIFVVVAFKILPMSIISLAKKACFNLHASLLPNYRGAAPINWAIINGEKQSGLTTFLLEKGVDTGKIIHQESMDIGEHETAGQLHDRMMIEGAELILKTVNSIENEDLSLSDQVLSGDENPAPKIFGPDCYLSGSLNLMQAYNRIRGLSPYPAAKIKIDGLNLKIYEAELTEPEEEENPESKILTDGKTFIKLGFRNGFLKLTSIQLEGKRRMEVDEFLRGYTISDTRFQ